MALLYNLCMYDLYKVCARCTQRTTHPFGGDVCPVCYICIKHPGSSPNFILTSRKSADSVLSSSERKPWSRGSRWRGRCTVIPPKLSQRAAYCRMMHVWGAGCGTAGQRGLLHGKTAQLGTKFRVAGKRKIPSTPGQLKVQLAQQSRRCAAQTAMNNRAAVKPDKLTCT